MAAASSAALESAPAVTTAAPSLQGPGCSGGGGADLQSWGPSGGRSVFAALCPSSLFLPRGERPILGCVPSALCSRACAVGIALSAAQPPPQGASDGAASVLLLGPHRVNNPH